MFYNTKVAFPLHGTVQFGLLWLTFWGAFPLRSVYSTWYLFYYHLTSSDVPNEPYHYQKHDIYTLLYTSRIGLRESSLTASLDVQQKTPNMLHLNSQPQPLLKNTIISVAYMASVLWVGLCRAFVCSVFDDVNNSDKPTHFIKLQWKCTPNWSETSRVEPYCTMQWKSSLNKNIIFAQSSVVWL